MGPDPKMMMGLASPHRGQVIVDSGVRSIAFSSSAGGAFQFSPGVHPYYITRFRFLLTGGITRSSRLPICLRRQGAGFGNEADFVTKGGGRRVARSVPGFFCGQRPLAL